MILVPMSKFDEEHRRTAWLDTSEVAGVEAYENDFTVTVLFKSGVKMKYGPFMVEDYEDFLDKLL